MKDTIYVAPSKVRAAQLLIRLSEEDGVEIDDAVRAIANADTIVTSGAAERDEREYVREEPAPQSQDAASLTGDDNPRDDEQALVKLVAKAGRGNKKAFKKLFDTLARSSYAIAFKDLGSVGEAADVVQRVFVEVWRSSPTFDGSRSVRSWIAVLTQQYLLDRGHAPTPSRQSKPESDPAPSYVTTSADAYWLNTIERELNSLVRERKIGSSQASDAFENVLWTTFSSTMAVSMPDLITQASEELPRSEAHTAIAGPDTLTQDEVDRVWAEIVREMQVVRVRESMAALPQVERDALSLVYFSGHSQSEVAQMLNLPVNSVRRHIQKGLLTLRGDLAAGGIEPIETSAGIDHGVQRLLRSIAETAAEEGTADRKFDVFISHASEDSDNIVRPLAAELTRLGLRVWLDQLEIRVGDSLRRKIDEGISQSRFVIVVLSPSFLAKGWSRSELDRLTTTTGSGAQVILPLWHELSKSEVVQRSPSLADKVALRTSEHTLAEIARQIATVLED